ncbi:MAG: NAD(P)-binding protein [Rhizobiales bacterium]|nr:NAD(P)-binding protein [Hyphomicrobiales bacterium]
MKYRMDATEQTTDVLVIGSGMAGLIAAAELQVAGRSVLVLDKSRAVGGRMASRRIGAATFDHGAQFITARSPRFAAQLGHWQETEAVQEWCRGFAERADGHARWRGKPTMTSVAKHVAHGLAVSLEKQIVRFCRAGDRWTAETNSLETFSAAAVVLTPPVPQSLALLDAGGVPLSPETRSRLAGIEYERCLAVLAVLDGPSRIPPPGGLTPAAGLIAWIADNQLKGISTDPAVTIHATHAFSLAHWDRDRQESGRRLLDEAAPWLGAGIKTFQVHGWRYSKPMQVDEQPCVLVSQSPPLVLAGDAFAGPRVEGAALSGWAAADTLLTKALFRQSPA